MRKSSGPIIGEYDLYENIWPRETHTFNVSIIGNHIRYQLPLGHILYVEHLTMEHRVTLQHSRTLCGLTLGASKCCT